MIQAASRIKGVKAYYFSTKLRAIKALEAKGYDVINLGVGDPDLQPHPSVIQALNEAAASPQANRYQPYRGTAALREAFSDWMQRFFRVQRDPETEILPLMGSKEGIVLISLAYLNPGEQVLLPNPGYPAYAAASRIAGAEGVYYDLKAERGWFPDLEALAKGDLSRAKLMWVNYPHMPTGARADKGQFGALVDFARTHGLLLVHDNPYAFLSKGSPLSIFQLAGAEAVALELHSLSKTYAMAGWRVGALMGAARLIEDVLRVKSNGDSGMYKPIQQAAVQALSLPEAWIAAQRATYLRRRVHLWALCDALGLRYERDTAGLFLWAQLPEGASDDKAWSDALLEEKHVFITPGSIFGSRGAGYVRLSLCQPEARLRLAVKRFTACG